ncbi:arginine kinase isoform X3 [Aethina tumida]|nr:arginine kinase isoform X3 [Aethina tumida]
MAKTCQRCIETCGAGKQDPTIVKALTEAFEKLQKSDSKSLLKKYLTADVFQALLHRKTSFGSSLLDCIQSGVANLDSGIGVYAADVEAYTVFAELFNPIIEEYHLNFTKTDTQPPVNFGNPNCMGDLDPKGQYIVSTRVRCGRSLAKYPLNPCMTEQNYLDLEQEVKSALQRLTGEIYGDYIPLKDMSDAVQKRLIELGYLFSSTNTGFFMPYGRGMFINDKRNFFVWVNQDEHLKIFTMQEGGDLGMCYRRLISGLQALSYQIKFARDSKFGFLNLCPSNIGTGFKVSVYAMLPNLGLDESKLIKLVKECRLQIKKVDEYLYKISSKQSLGLCEWEVLHDFQDAILSILDQEDKIGTFKRELFKSDCMCLKDFKN